MDTWAPMFAISMGIPRAEMGMMSVPTMVDHVDYWLMVNGRDDG